MNCILQFLSTNAAAISALATIVIAVFSVLSWWVSHRIHQSTEKRDKEFKNALINLTAAALVKPECVGEKDKERVLANSFNSIREELKNLES